MRRITLWTAFLFAGMAAPAAAAPTVRVTPFTVSPGSVALLRVWGFSPGGYPGIIILDGTATERIFIPVGDGLFEVLLRIPATAATGPHRVEVCAALLGGPCLTGEFEQRGVDEFQVEGFAPALASVDALVRAVEVTQGLRTRIPERLARTRLSHSTDDPFEHVPNRRTVVRVYPWLFIESAGAVPPLTATLAGFGPSGLPLVGSPLRPLATTLLVDASDSLEEQRGDFNKSWNFVLPPHWTEEGEIRLQVIVNPLGPGEQPECAGCRTNNGFGVGIRFRSVQTQRIDLKVHSTTLFWRDSAGLAQSLSPPAADVAETLRWWLNASPIEPGLIDVEWGFRQMSWNYPMDVPVLPPVPGVQSALVVQDAVTRENAGSQKFYTFLPIVLSHRWHPSPPPGGGPPLGCAGGAAIDGDVPKSFNSATCGSVFAQEATHTLGMNHACISTPCAHGEERGGGWDPSYPEAHGAVEPDAFGFDTFSMTVFPPRTATGHMHDFMSYGNPTWVSMYTWQNVINAFRSVPASTSLAAASRASASGSRYLWISGRILADDHVELEPAFHVTLPDDAAPPEDDPDGEYLLIFLGARGQVLFRRRFEATPHTAHGFAGEGFPKAVFQELVPPLSGVRRVIIRRKGRPLASLRVSDADPTVRLVSPAAGDQWPDVGTRTIRWEASDADLDRLSYLVEASRDGSHWVPLGGTSGETELTLDLEKIPLGAGEWELRVQASDGFRLAEESVGPIFTPGKAPRALILSPVQRKVVTSPVNVGFQGFAADLQDSTIPDQAMNWYLDGKHVGTGRSVDVPSVSPGKHVASLWATNSLGLLGSMDVEFFVETANPQPDVDSDTDGLIDMVEWVVYGTHPLFSDSDQDSLDDGNEVEIGTDPRNPDSDGDGVLDGIEVGRYRDPLGKDEDSDSDQIPDDRDNCPAVFNADQGDLDLDGKGDACDSDGDGDGVANDADACPTTEARDLVNPAGCSIADSCPCDARSDRPFPWLTHVQYVACVAKASNELEDLGLIDEKKRRSLLLTAIRSGCGLMKGN